MTPETNVPSEEAPAKKRRPKRLREKRPPLSIEQILAWIDAHHERTGEWPSKTSGHVHGTLQETWNGVHLALYRGSRGLPGGTTLAQLLQEKRGVRNRQSLPPLTCALILAWADAHQRRTGEWPTSDSGDIPEAPGEKWCNVNASLANGSRGLPGGDSLPRLLERERAVRNRKALPHYSVKQILGWMDAFFAEKGRWPTNEDGPIPYAPGETWSAVDAALYQGSRGLPGGMTLVRLLEEHRGIRNRKHLPPLTEEQIVTWARAHHAATGSWPTENSGPVGAAPGEVWGNISQSLREGLRGLPGGDSLARLLARQLHVRNSADVPPFSVPQILEWADAHNAKHGHYPKANSGPIKESPRDTWQAVDDALRVGLRGLEAGHSLARLLAEHRRVRNKGRAPKLTTQVILLWAVQHYQRKGRHPVHTDGLIPGSGGETWNAVNLALMRGTRGLPGGLSLTRLLARHGLTSR
jgi:hypothetical protein